ncbi:triose-phosphate isomerase [Buchnera aphidicola]|uniref:triose-phosphate isomerase n=1 Tax=Buchnera aphidicola TaxID=9 RepID=UPI0031B89C06
MKKFIITANWKLNGNNSIINYYIENLKNYFNENKLFNKIIFVPPVIYINSIKNSIKKKNFFLGAQNVDINLSGAFTGEISATMLKDIGVKYVIIGHSERRKFHYENNDCIAKKFKILQENGITPILCIGENLKEKKNEKTELILKKQIEIIFNIVGRQAFQNAIIAYEPIWAIGTGENAKIQYVEKIHKFIKEYVMNNSNLNPKEIKVQYGGSVNENNIQQFFASDHIDGVLVGNSILIYKNFIKMIKYTNFLK